MNSSTLRRLASDHASLHTTELPPHYLFPSYSADSSIPDDLTQLTILLTGPQGTPYSQGLWELNLKLPEEYPKNPPKAYFRTRIWHPNVEEKSGSVCVDTLKNHWEAKLTLRDVLVTISCLLIQPNPDSALNATAGMLLQDDYEAFVRQARLMTSIHANIPLDLREAASAAKRRGEDPSVPFKDDTDHRSTLKGNSASSSSVVMKKLPSRILNTQFAPIPKTSMHVAEDLENNGDEQSVSAENDPMLSFTSVPVPAQSQRRSTLAKRPLSDHSCSTEFAGDSFEPSCVSPSMQNVTDNAPAFGFVQRGTHLTERNPVVNSIGRSLQDYDSARLMTAPEGSAPPAKRICSEESKENVVTETSGEKHAKALPLSSVPAKVHIAGMRKASAPGAIEVSGGKGGKGRIGLRRL